jgi:succinate dehydrogenase/fumarate reductase cytochrome b subunit (b558 family)
VAMHLWTYTSALRGPSELEHALGRTGASPYLVVAEALFIWVPLAYHGVYGLFMALRSRPNVRSYPYSYNWMHALQRASGIVVLVFLAYHIHEVRLPLARSALLPADIYVELAARLSSTVRGIPLAALVYLTGLAAVTFHLANGLYGFCFSYGITVSRRATRLASTVFGVVGVGLFLLGASTVIYLATGSHFGLGAGLGTSAPHSELTANNPVDGH